MNQTLHAFTPELLKECWQFVTQFQSLYLATSNLHAQADASYAPFVEVNGVFYVFVSALALHTQNLSVNPKCSILWIEPEAECKHVFARRRLVLQCQVKFEARDTELFTKVITQMKVKFGDFIDLIAGLGDFQLFALQPHTGQYVKGFGKAYRIEAQQFMIQAHH